MTSRLRARLKEKYGFQPNKDRMLYKRGLRKLAEKEYQEAYECFLEAAQNQYSEATYKLGYMYLLGLYPERDYKKAFHYFEVAYDFGHKMIEDYESILEMEEAIAEDEKAVLSYRQYLVHMIECEDWTAAIYIGDKYKIGLIYPKDIPKAIEYYQVAASHGVNIGYECLGTIYYEGEGVDADYQKAYEYFTAFEGYCSYCKWYYLGEMYRLGRCVEQDKEKAEWYFRQILDDERQLREDQYYDLAEKSLKTMLGEE